jgi:molybdate-binding protein/DNA-binding XRE family transcriptional regulator
MGAQLHTGLSRLRRARGLSQAELAARGGISRQALFALESGRSEPSTGVALRLARELGVRLEELFWLADDAPLSAELSQAVAAGRGPARARKTPRGGLRVALAEVEGRLVAHPLSADDPGALVTAADGLLLGTAGPLRVGAAVRVSPLRSGRAVRENLLAVGCDPALAMLAMRLPDRSAGARLAWVHKGSLAALQALSRGHAHLAGTHLRDEASGEFNVAAVRALFPSRAMLLVSLSRWEQGLAVARGNPLGLRRGEDLAGKGVRLVNREPGAGARALLDRLLRRAGIPERAVAGYNHTVQGHLAVAAAVASGGADAGISTRAAALAHGLSFVPLEEERFDLVLPRESASDPRIGRLLDTLRSKTLRRELGTLPGYSAARSGELVAEIAVRRAGA